MPVYSMTGFGESARTTEAFEIRVEIKSVNHRFLDVTCRLPQVFLSSESKFIKIIKDNLNRGRVDVLVFRNAVSDAGFELTLHEDLFDTYIEALRQAFRMAGLKEGQLLQSSIARVLERKEVLELVPREIDVSLEQETIKEVIIEALQKLIKMREDEGSELKEAILSQLTSIEKLVSQMEKEAPKINELIRERLIQRLEKYVISIEIEPQRLAQEVAILTDRADVTEEIVRLKSHLKQLRSTLDSGGAIGRKLEFVLQEIGREVNTIGSKAQSTAMTNFVIDAKTDIEKMREQVLNIE
jgi:uncharacterized protein (TIGR00255 family)